MTETSTVSVWPFLPGVFTVGTLPPAAQNVEMMAYCTDSGSGCYMLSDGITWRPIVDRRIETYAGTTNASGDYTVTYSIPYSAIPNVQPVAYLPTDPDTRVRLSASTVNGFTIRSEKNIGLTVLSLTVLGFGTNPVPNIPVRVLVTES